MSKKVRSAKGEMVDFDLLKIKQQIGSAPPPTDVRARQDFIEKRFRRRVKKVAPPAPKIKNENGEVPLVAPSMPGTEELEIESKFIEDFETNNDSEVDDSEIVEETNETKNVSSRQRARPAKPNKTE